MTLRFSTRVTMDHDVFEKLKLTPDDELRAVLDSDGKIRLTKLKLKPPFENIEPIQPIMSAEELLDITRGDDE